MENNALSLESHMASPFRGDVRPPGDKSISHRAIILGSIASGRTRVRGLLEGQDVLSTISAMRALGVSIVKKDGVWHIEGEGLENLKEASTVLDLGNSGTSARLLIGLLGTRPFTSVFTGDASLRKRPMGRVIEPLSEMGAAFMGREGGRLPLAVRGARSPKAISYALPVASAQVKSAVLLASLSAEGTTQVIEKTPTRDHSERLLRAMGAGISVEKDGPNDIVSIQGGAKLVARDIDVPADISSAAFLMVAACLREGSDIALHGVGMNERRAGIVQSLIDMGANIDILDPREICGEPVADLRVHASPLKGFDIPAERAPSMIDEYPVLAVAAACAEGTSRFRGLSELRVKESDRLELVAQGLTACGAKVEIEGDDLIIHGTGRPPEGGAAIQTSLDHRIAMSFLVLGGVTETPVRIDDVRPVATSFPDFVEVMNALGARIGTNP